MRLMPSSPVSADVTQAPRTHWENETMYTTEYDLAVAHDRFLELRTEMKLIRMAQAQKSETSDRPSLLDRLISWTSRGAHVQTPHRKVSVGA